MATEAQVKKLVQLGMDFIQAKKLTDGEAGFQIRYLIALKKGETLPSRFVAKKERIVPETLLTREGRRAMLTELYRRES
jgi:hypothetical protein